jgi:hypothetical protein
MGRSGERVHSLLDRMSPNSALSNVLKGKGTRLSVPPGRLHNLTSRSAFAAATASFA